MEDGAAQPSDFNHQPSDISHPTSFKGIAYRDIISEWFRRTGGEPAIGERNDRLHRLAAHLRYITDNNEQTLLEIMPRTDSLGLPRAVLLHAEAVAGGHQQPTV